MPFDLMDFLAPLDLWTLLMAAILGAVMGVVITRIVGVERQALAHLWWQVAGGIVFFVPLSFMRAFQGSPVWERLLATVPLWMVYVVASYVASVVLVRIERNRRG